MSKTIIPVTLLSGLTLIAGAAFAQATFPTNPERNSIEQSAPVAKTRAEVLQELQDFRKNPVSPDGWEYVGGERQWALIPHRYDFAGGKLVHSDPFDHNTPKVSSKMTKEEQIKSQVLYKNSR